MNANDELQGYTGTDNYYKYILGLVITDGTKAIADKFQCYWFLDLIASYQSQLKNEEFQVWSLGKYADSSAIVICTDGNDNILVTQEIPFTDFKADEATLWVEGNVILLPSEH